MAKTRHCTFESQILKNSLLSLTDSLPVLTIAPYADATPRWPRHTTFKNNKLCAKSNMSYYHSTSSPETQGLWVILSLYLILRDPGVVSRFQVSAEEPLGTLSYKTSSKGSQSFWHLIGARKSLCLSAQSEWSMVYLGSANPVGNCPKTSLLPTVFSTVFVQILIR